MPFDWIDFFKTRGVHYVTTGPNISAGNVAIRCPLCGDDPSHHMSISIDGAGWRCWRRPTEHAGKSPIKLIRAILSCSHEDAVRISGRGSTIPHDIGARLRSTLLGPSSHTAKPRALPEMPDEFKKFTGLPSSRPYATYLERRGYTYREIPDLTHDYDLRYCTRGSYYGRIIFPIYADGKLVTWTGRAVSKRATLRYKTLSADPDKAKAEGYRPAANPITEYLLWQDDLIDTDADTIIITEGPFDALRVSTLGRRYGIAATCLFTIAPSGNQLATLLGLLTRFRHRYICLDAGTFGDSLRLSAKLASAAVKQIRLPKHIKDPAELKVPADLLALLEN